MKHLARAGALLALAVGAFMFLRLATSQASVPLIGLVRSDNAMHWASLEPRLGTATQCVKCHSDVDMLWSRSAHSGQTCEACHGAGDRHMAYGAMAEPAHELCITCHEQIAGRPAYFPQISRLDHYPQQACTNCHDPHSPAAAFPKIPHNVQGREDCLACHGVPNIAGIPPNHANRSVEMCVGCHKPGERSKQ
jgi:hypothetical protein